MNDHPLYSCDDHLDLGNVPRDVWSTRVPKKYREAAPHVVEQGGQAVWLAGGRPIGVSGRYADHLTALGRRPELEDIDGLRPSNPKLRLEDMAGDGIHASIVYGAGALSGFPIADPEAKASVLRAWNDWAAEEFNAFAPNRLSALPFLPVHDTTAAVDELERCLRLGHKGAIVNPFEMDLGDPDWDRLWAAAAEAELPISFHIGQGTKLSPTDTRQRAPFSAVVPLQLDEPLALMIFLGALERNPKLQIVLAESGIGWLPYFVARMDDQFEKHCLPHPDVCIRTKPSELFGRQVFATFEEEPLGPMLIPLLGANRFMWACDYPHPDSTWPNSREKIEESLGALGEQTVLEVTAETCKRLYKLG